jgi:NADH-quinone oxidoreductase subunit G
VKVFKDENDAKGRLIMSCMEPVRDGLRLSIWEPEAREFRAHIIEWLMTNHPHDCAVCDEGGACHLQDMTVMTGHAYRQYRYPKRTYRNQYLGPFLNHEMNRCIGCYRCVRYYKDYAGGKDLDVFAAHNHVYFGRHEDGVLESEFSGNLAEVCPTGVFTDKTLKQHYTRKWDLTSAPSVCQHCSLGCNTIAGERYGSLRQITSRYNGEVNGYFLCDRGRFGYEFVNSFNRVRKPLLRFRDPEAAPKEVALLEISDILKNHKVIGIGSPRASLESNFALQTLVGKSRFYHGVSDMDHHLVELSLRILRERCAYIPSLKEVEKPMPCSYSGKT